MRTLDPEPTSAGLKSRSAARPGVIIVTYSCMTPVGGAHDNPHPTPALHHAPRRRGRLPAGSARTAAGDAGNRIPRQHIGRPGRLPHRRVPPGFERSWICQGSERGNRISLGGGSIRLNGALTVAQSRTSNVSGEIERCDTGVLGRSGVSASGRDLAKIAPCSNLSSLITSTRLVAS